MVTSLFSGNMAGEEGSRAVTLPFRAFCLLVSLIVLGYNWRSKETLTTVTKISFIYLCLLMIKLFWDTSFGGAINVEQASITQYWLYLVGLTFIPCLALIKSIRLIDYQWLLLMLFVMISLTVGLIYFRQTAFQEALNERMKSNAALGSIATGNLGLTGMIVAIFVFLVSRQKAWIRFLAVGTFLISTLLWLRAGSRGPILAFLFLGSFSLIAFSIKSTKGFLVSISFLAVFFLLLGYLLNELREISPVLYDRLLERSSSQTSDRDPLFLYAWEAFLRSPILGDCFGIYHGSKIIYPHNIFLDALMQWGIIGFSLMTFICIKCFKFCFEAIKNHTAYLWIGLLWLQVLIKLCVSSTVSMEPSFWVLTILVAQASSCERLVNVMRKVPFQSSFLKSF